jgi:hypothetical protein
MYDDDLNQHENADATYPDPDEQPTQPPPAPADDDEPPPLLPPPPVK